MKFSVHALGFLIISLLLINSYTYPQSIPLKTYTIEDGISSNTVYDILQDYTGRMYFATDKGLSIYDGKSWLNLGKSDQLKQERMLFSRLAQDSSIWLYSSENQHRFHQYKNDKFLTDTRINNIKSTKALIGFDVIYYKNQYIFCAAFGNEIKFYKNGKWSQVALPNFESKSKIYDVKKDKNNFLIGTSEGLFQINPFDLSVKLIIDKIPDGLSKQILAIHIEQSQNNTKDESAIWVLSNGWLGEIINNKIHFLHETQKLKSIPSLSTFFILYNGHNKVYYGSMLEKFKLNLQTDRLFELNLKLGFINPGAYCAFKDFENNIWFGSFRGIEKLSAYKVQNYYKDFGLLENESSAIIEIRKNKFLVGHNLGYSILNINGAKSFSVENIITKDFFNGRFLRFAKDSADQIWIAGNYLGLGKLNTDYSITWIPPINKKPVSAVATDIYGEIYVASDNSIYKVADNKLVLYYSDASNKISIMRDLFFDDRNTLYVATSHGLLILDSSKNAKHFTSNDYKVNNQFSLLKLNDRELLIATNGGLVKFVDGDISILKINNYVNESPVYSLLKDHSNNIWIGSSDGVIKWDGEQALKISMEAGLSARETNRGAMIIDSQNRLWVGTEGGLSCIDLGQFESKSNVKLELGVLELSDGTTHSLNRPVVLGFNQNSIIFSFQGISFINEKNIEYRVYLSGFDETWVDLGKQNSIRYTNIPPGKYQLFVKSRNPSEEWSKVAKSEILTIKAPFYSRWWFFVLVSLGLITLVFLFFKYFSQKRYNTQLESEVESRTYLLRESEGRLSTIISNTPSIIISFNRKGEIQFQSNIKEKLNIDFKPHLNIRQVFPDLSIKIERIIKLVFDEQKSITEEVIVGGNDIKYYELTFSPVIRFGAPIEAIMMTNDITVRKKYEIRLKKLNECLISFGVEPISNMNKLLQLLGEELIADATIYDCIQEKKLVTIASWNLPSNFQTVDDPDGHICTDVINLQSNEIVYYEDLSLTRYASSDRNVVQYELVTFIGIPVTFGGSKRGSLGAVFTTKKKLTEEDSKLLSIVASALAVEEERRIAESLLKDSIEEKEVLLKEIHHRVKNNLQIITSLLSLQAAQSDDDMIKKSLTESFNRIRTMSLIHERIYRSTDLSHLDFNIYVRELTGFLIDNFSLTNAVTLKIDIQNVFLELDTAIPCGLLLNELTTNALKYAFPNSNEIKEPSIKISCLIKDNYYKLIFEDNGIGLPESINFELEQLSLGLNLVKMLVYQIEGTIKIEREKGTKYIIEFPSK
jgi:two-component sensor histidine kinase/ligand-binding sensor domain-containing protein